MVNRQIREMCVFAIHNFLKDPPFIKIDLISCRNVLIYMDTFLQKKALTTFHYALKETGFLLLGKSETTGPASELFSSVSKGAKIYSRKPSPSHFDQVVGEAKHDPPKERNQKIATPEIQQTDYRKSAESVLLSKHTPPGVIVNKHMDIVHFHGDTSPYLQPSQGKPSFNLLKMAREGLAFELRNALHKAKTSESAVITEGIPVKTNGNQRLVTIEVNPLTHTPEPHYLILFNKTPVPETGKIISGTTSAEKTNKKTKQRIERLEKELSQAREDMRSITEDQEAVNEELQSANEELLSSNEEMQSMNEELETSKEELQSTNEELTIVNQELLDKQEQLSAARLYAESIVATIREPLVVLDRAFCIRNANLSFYKKFDLTEPETENKPFFKIKNGLFDITDLRRTIEKIVPEKAHLDNYEFSLDLPPIGRCIMLLNARHIPYEKSKEQLILIAIEDITEQKILEEKRKNIIEEMKSEVKEKSIGLSQSNVQLEQFIHTASHEFQEPLRKIITYSKLLQQEKELNINENAESYLAKIEAASLRMSKLIQDMLNFGSITSQKKLFEKTDLNVILKNVLFDFELLAAEEKAEITCDKLPVIEAIPFQMNQLFYELIYNALKFSRSGVPPVITISSRRLPGEEIKFHPNLNARLHYYEIKFQDNGIGFDQKFAQKIFVMFQRLVTDRSYPGTGIGLALCKKIVDDYQGAIFARGKENEGSAFYVILPEKQDSEAK